MCACLGSHAIGGAFNDDEVGVSGVCHDFVADFDESLVALREGGAFASGGCDAPGVGSAVGLYAADAGACEAEVPADDAGHEAFLAALIFLAAFRQARHRRWFGSDGQIMVF